ncbi:Molybdopterin synthase sulfur carrier subunit [Penicillium capsulatum]|uniref:Molybdopterin synthase sulfur carrier subunit n=1 Tax=Penicillium capsulatum TaxID=69766 RepID=A0A9W9LY30_9EURO|nr:Molybdopterin synthase sulfur carrier subunit [Penicillium capsulatum]KAJ6121311.1 Molybdopterin synthase sulfur carrier subunit [Penicillium capsulatum]
MSSPDPTTLSSRPLSAQDAFTIHYFASASQYTGRHTEHLRAPLALSQLFPTLEAIYPGIQTVLKSCAVSLAGEYVDLDEEPGRLIGVGDEVAIIPPVSSG